MASRPEDTIPSLLFSPPRCEKQGLHTGSSRSRRFPKQASFSPLKFAEPGRKKKKKQEGSPHKTTPHGLRLVPRCAPALRARIEAPYPCGRGGLAPLGRLLFSWRSCRISHSKERPGYNFLSTCETMCVSTYRAGSGQLQRR